MRFFSHIIAAIITLSLVQSCISTPSQKGGADPFFADADTLDISYAKGFVVLQKGDCRFVEVNDMSEENSRTYKYALVPHTSTLDSIPEGYEIIRTPVNRLICMTTLQLSSLIKLDAADRVVGLTSIRYLHDAQIGSRLESGQIKRIGIEGEFDVEVVMASKPELIFISPFKRGGYSGITDLGITTFNYLGYKEPSPLGQAEWIKLVGMILGVEERAEEIFAEVESRYNQLKEMTLSVESRPKVMSGELHSGSWYVVGGESYLAQLFRDAGGDYFMHNDKESGGFYVDYESVYAQGHDADYWRIVNNHNGAYTYDILLASDSRYSDFKPFRDRGVIYCNLRDTPFYERTPMEPDVVLADLIHIFHPTLLPQYQPIYYRQLK